MVRNLLRSVAACSIGCIISLPAVAEPIGEFFTDENGTRAVATLTIEESGIYQFSISNGIDANVIIDGAQIIDGQSAARMGSIALPPGEFEISVETNSGSPTPQIDIRAMNANSIASSIASTATATAPVMPVATATTQTQMVAALPLREAATEIQVRPRRNLRNRLRDRVRDRAIEMAVLNNEIARPTVNGVVGDFVRVGTQMPIEAIVPPNSRFVRWAGDIAALANPNAQATTLNVNAGGVNVFAIYEDINSTETPPVTTPPETSPTTTPTTTPTTPPDQPVANAVTVQINNGSGDGAFAPGTQVVIRAETAQIGQSFTSWTGDTGALASATDPVTILTVPDTAVTLTAQFSASPITASLFSSTAITSSRGATVTGVVAQPASEVITFDVIGPDGTKSASNRVASIDPNTGGFALRVFEDELPDAGSVTVIMSAATANGDAQSAVNFSVSNETDEIAQLVSRITYGASPAALARARQIGFDAYLNEQLNPTSINDSAFRALNPDDLFDHTLGNSDLELRRMALAYAVFSERQLQEVMANFWENHFYTTPGNSNGFHGESVEKAAFRENAFGNFRDLLEISAKSPIMMAYLNNNDSRVGNINENYARELLELHTVGVNSSYTEDDLIEVARILTGWDLVVTNENRPNGVRPTHAFFFDASRHDTGDKTVSFIDTTFQGLSGNDGIREGEALLDILAAHPDTASFICGKLVELFVSDTPLPELTAQCASTFLSTQGNTREMLRTILTSSEFRSNLENHHSKFKHPFEYVSSLMRIFELTPESGRFASSLSSVSNFYENSGYDTYEFADPTGLPEVGDAWVGAASVVTRTQFAVRAMRQAAANLELDRGAIFEAAPADTPEGIAALICDRAMLNRCTKLEFTEMVEAVYGTDGIFDPSRNIESAVSRALQVAVVSKSFGLQ